MPGLGHQQFGAVGKFASGVAGAVAYASWVAWLEPVPARLPYSLGHAGHFSVEFLPIFQSSRFTHLFQYVGKPVGAFLKMRMAT